MVSKFTLKKAEVNRRELNEKIQELKYNYKPKYEKEKEEINEVLIHVNDMLEYLDKIIEAFRDGTFSSEYLKKSDDAAYDYVLDDANNFIQKTESMAKKINLSLFEDFFLNHYHQLIMQKSLLILRIQINTKNL